MTTSPVILNDTILSNGSMAVLAGDPYKGVTSSTYYGFDNLQIAIISANNSPVTLNQGSGSNLSFASAGDSPNMQVSDENGNGDESTGGGTLLGLPNGDIAVVTWGDTNHNYDLQILNSSGGVVTAPFVIGNDLEGANPSEGNPYAVIATNGSEFVVAWNTDDITGLYFERFSLTGAPIGGVVTVKTASALNPTTGTGVNENNNSDFGGSLAIDSQGNVILGFGAEDIYHSGYFNEYNSSNTEIVGTPSSPQVMGSGAILNQDQAPFFAPVAGGGFVTAGYTASGTYNNSNATWSGTFTLNVQKVSTTGSVSTIATVPGFSGGVQTRSAFGETTLSNGLVAFQEDAGQTGDQAANDWDTLNPTGNALTRDAFSVTPGAYNGTPTYASSYHSIPFPIVNVTGGGLATLSVNSSNQLVANGLDTAAAPVVTAGGTVTFDGGGSVVTLDSGLTVTDTGSSTLASATVTIGGFISGDTLSVGTADGLSVSYDSATGTLTLTGTASLAIYQTALDSVSYSFSPSDGDPTGGGSHTSRTIDWVVNDGTANSNTGTSTLDLVHEPPVVTAGGTVDIEFGSAGSVVLDSTLTVTDPDSGGDLTGATVNDGSDGTLNFTNGNGITGVFNGTNLILSGTATVAQYQAALRSITFSAPALVGPQAIEWTVSDGVDTSAPVTSTVDVTGAPGLTLGGGTPTFTGGGSPVTVKPTLTVSDPSNADLSSATVSIGAGFLSGDTLNFTGQNGITGTYNPGTGALILTGTATLAQYQTALESITYSFTPSNGDPTGAGAFDTSRTITWALSDGTASSTPRTNTLDTVHVAPVVTAGGPVTYGVGAPATTLDGVSTITDVDSGGNLIGASVTVGGFVAGDVLGFTNQGGITGSYDAVHGVLTLSGTASLANYLTALDSVTFSATAIGNGSRTISWGVNDGAAVSTATNTLTVVEGPQITAGATATFFGGGVPVALDSTLTATDPSSADFTGATVSVGTGFTAGDTLNFTGELGISGTYNSATGVLVLAGTASVANYQTALDSITYSFSPANGDPTAGGGDTSRTIDWVASDGTFTSPAVTSTLNVGHVPPTVTPSGSTVTWDQGGPAVTIDSGITLADPDSGGNLVSALVSIGGFSTGDVLAIPAADLVGTNIIQSYNAGTGRLTLTGTDTIAHYQTALEEVQFSSTAATPAVTPRTLTFTVSDGAASTTNTADTVDVGDQPAVVAGAAATFDGGGAAVALDATLSVTDASSATLASAMVSIATGFITGDTLNFTNQNSITGSYNSATGVLSLSGTASLANYQTALDSITYGFTPSNGDPTGGGTHTARTIDWSVNDGVLGSTVATSTLTTVHEPPSVTAGGAANFVLTGPAVALDGALTLGDPDSGGTLTGATVSVGTGFLTGDTLAAATTGTAIHASYNAGTGVLSLTGTDTAADYQTVLDGITYNATESDPTNGGTDNARTIDWTVNDGQATSTQATSALAIIAPPTVTPHNQSVAFNVSDALSNIFTVSGAAITQYDVYLNSPNDGTVTGGSTAVTPNATIAETAASFAGMDFVGGLLNGSDGLWLRAYNGVWSPWVLANLTDTGAVSANNQSVGYLQSVALSSIFTVSGGGSITSYNVYLDGPNDGAVTGGSTAVTPNVTVNETTASFAGMDFVGALKQGSDILWLQAVTAQGPGTWVAANLTDTGAVTATNQSVGFNQSVALSNIFTVSGGGSITSYNVYLDGPNDGAVTGGSTAVTPGVTINETTASFAGMDFVGALTKGSDILWLQAVTAQGPGTWVAANLTDTGAVTANNQTVAFNQSVALSSIFTVNGSPITSYNVYLDGPNDGTVTGGSTAVTPGVTINETAASFAGMDFVGGGGFGGDILWLQAVDGAAKGTWVAATLTEPGNAPDMVSGANQTLAFNQSVALSSIFTVTGTPPSQYDVFLDSPNDGTVTDAHGAIATNAIVPEASLAGINYTAGGTAGSDTLWLRAFNGQWSGWTAVTITDASGSGNTISAGNGNNVIYMGGPRQTFLDNAGTYADTVVGFSEANGDSIHLTTDTAADALAHSTQVNGGADTLITLADSSTILLKGVSHIDAGFFS